MSERVTHDSNPEVAELVNQVAAYAEQNLGSYVMDLEAAIETSAANGSDVSSIARPLQRNRSEVERLGQDMILEGLKEQFLVRYPERVMRRNYYVEHEGKRASDMVPPAYVFEVIRLFVPKEGGHTPKGSTDVGISPVH